MSAQSGFLRFSKTPLIRPPLVWGVLLIISLSAVSGTAFAQTRLKPKPKTELIQEELLVKDSSGALVNVDTQSSLIFDDRAPAVFPTTERIVVIGDIHGDYDQFVQVLKDTGLVDAKLKWQAGDTHLVQMGDVVDRGDGSKKAIDLLRQLETEARAAGGYVHTLVGNHEALNIAGDLRYVTPGEFAAYRTKKSKATRNAYYKQTIAAIKARTPKEELPKFDKAYRKAWEAKVPLGYVEHRRAWSNSGIYGKWVSKNPAIIKIGRTMFLHGGIGPAYATSSLEELNEQISNELASSTPLTQQSLSFQSEGPLWYRGFANPSRGKAEEILHLEKVLKNFDVDRIVVAHTPIAGAIVPLFDSRVVATDVGLAAHYGARRAALLIEGDQLTAIHRGRPLVLPSSDAGVPDYLAEAAKLDPKPSPAKRYAKQFQKLFLEDKTAAAK
ncbi:MAG: metallophosphoesterase [Pseudomonadota bacterium]